jgi:hypothetical protein
LGANLFETMSDRLQYLSRRFCTKHKLFRPHVEWSEDELRELSVSLRAFVRSGEDMHWARWRRWQHMLTRGAQMRLVEDDPIREQ